MLRRIKQRNQYNMLDLNKNIEYTEKDLILQTVSLLTIT